MTEPNHEIGSGLPPHAAEVEPPAAVVHAGGSADKEYLIGIHEAARDLLQARDRLGYAVHDRRDLWEILAAAASDVANDVGMGVTANAILLLGNVTSHIIGAPDRLYEVEQIDAGAGTLLIRRRGTGNIHRISIVQLEGQE